MIAQPISKSYHREEDLLADAFDAFNRTTQKLQQAYKILEDGLEVVSKELEIKNIELQRKILEVENMKQYANNIIDSVTSGLIVIDEKGKVTTFNKRASEITGIKDVDVIGRVLPQRMAIFKSELNKSLKNQNNTFGEYYFKRGGEDIPIDISTSLLFDSSQNKKGAIAIFNDLSEIKELQEKLHRSERLSALGEMAAGVAHEIRNPLGGIEGFASLLHRDLAKMPKEQKLAKNIISGAQSLNRIVSDLLLFTKPIKTRFTIVDLTRIIKEVILYVKTSHPGGRVVIEDDLLDEQLIKGDAYHLKQLFLNLAINAVESTDGLINIGLTSRDTNRETTLRISDDGCGISEKQKIRLFDPFYTTKEKGTGLGLAIAYRIVEEHGAKIDVESEVNEGTSFTVTFKKAVRA